MKRELPALVQPSEYYPLLIFQVGGDEASRQSPRDFETKRDFRALGQLVKRSGMQVEFSSVPPVAGPGEVRNRKSQQISIWLQAWCHR